MRKDIEEKFEQDSLNIQIKKMKRKSLVKTLTISIIGSIVVMIVFIVLNTSINIKQSNKALELEESYTQLTIPNGYILDASFDFEFLGRKSEYTIARDIGPRSVILERKKIQYGLLPKFDSMNYQSGPRYKDDSLKTDGGFWKSGYRKMIFYHPSVEYKGYRNDLNLLEKIPDGKVIEIGLSFDKSYNAHDINKILDDLNISWLGFDMFTDDYIKNEKKEADEYDVGAVYISESDMIGVSMHWIGAIHEIKHTMPEIFDRLKQSPMKEHQKIYEKYYTKEKIQIPKVIAATVYGTKDELIKLKNNPHIKASAIGVVEDLY